MTCAAILKKLRLCSDLSDETHYKPLPDKFNNIGTKCIYKFRYRLIMIVPNIFEYASNDLAITDRLSEFSNYLLGGFFR